MVLSSEHEESVCIGNLTVFSVAVSFTFFQVKSSVICEKKNAFNTFGVYL